MTVGASITIGEFVLPFRLSTEEADAALKGFRKKHENDPPLTPPVPKPGTPQDPVGFLEKLTGGMRDFRREQKQEGATAKYFVSEFASFIPIGTKAHDVVMGLTAGLAGGLGLGLAIEAATIGVKWFTEYLEAEEKAAKAAAEATAKHTEEMAKQARHFEDLHLSLAGIPQSQREMIDAQRQFTDSTKKEREELEKLNRELAIHKGRRDVLSIGGGAGEDSAAAALMAQIAAVERAMGPAEQRLADAKKRIQVYAEEEAAKAAAEATEKARKEREEKEKREAEKRLERAKAEAEREKQRLAEMATLRAKAQHEEIDEQLAAEAAFASERGARMLQREKDLAALRQHYRYLDEAGGNEAKGRELQELDEWYVAQLKIVQDQEDLKLRIQQEYSRKRLAIVPQEATAERIARDAAKSAWSSFSTSMGAEYGKLLRGSRAYEAAMRAQGQTTAETADLSAASIAAMVQDSLAGVGQQAVVEALKETALGLASLAIYNPDAAAKHFASAGTWGLVAAAAGTAAAFIGANRGMTAAERADVEAARKSNEGAGTSSGSDVSGGRYEQPGFTGQAAATVTREIVYVVIGDPFETPAETARRAGRRMQLADRLGMKTEAS